MSTSNLTPLVRKAAHTYFARDAGDNILRYLSSAHHRRIMDAVHDTYRRIPTERERELIAAVYEPETRDFAMTVSDAAYRLRFRPDEAWDVVRTFTRGVEARILSEGK